MCALCRRDGQCEMRRLLEVGRRTNGPTLERERERERDGTGEAAVRSNEGGGRAGEKNAGASQESAAVTCVVV